MTTPTTAAQAADSVLDRDFPDLDAEFAATRRVLERFPAEHADWKPHEKSMALAKLAAHVANLPTFAATMLEGDELDMAVNMPQTPVARTAEELLAVHDRTTAAAREALRGATAEQMAASWRLRMGDTVFLEAPRGLLMRQHLVTHVAHHRGQLTVYYRLVGVPVPGLFGPSADEQ